MILLRGHILGFGKLQERIVEFQSGLNLIFAANEGGKSTLQRFLVALLYGQLRSDLKVQRRLDPWVEQYKPWHAREYGGILWCRLADGREVEIHRTFGKEETRIEIRSSAGDDITRQYEQQRNGEVLFARSHFGMPKELFESVGMIRENRVAEINGYETIRDRIANLAQSGDEELSMRQSLARIQEKLDSIGSDRAPTRPYKQTMDLVQNLQAERKALEERRAQFQNWVEDRNRIAGEISVLERELLKAQSALLSARKREMAAKIRSLEEIQSELSDLRAAIEGLDARADFPADRLEELNQLVGSSESTGKHLSEIREEKESALKQLSSTESQRRQLAACEPLAAGNEAEKITEWFVSYLSITLQKDGLQKTISRLNDEAAAVEKRLNELSQAFSDPQKDWERIAREAAEDEQAASENCRAIGDRIAIEKSNHASAVRTMRGRRAISAVFLLLAAANAIPYLWELTGISHWFHLGLGAGSAIVAIAMLVASIKFAKTAGRMEQMGSQLEIELRHAREEGGKKRRSLSETISNSGFQNLESFLAAAKGSDQDRQKLADLRARSIESDQQREQLAAKSAEIYQLLKDGLAKAGLTCSPGNLKFQIDQLRANLRRFREVDAEYSACLKNTDSLKSKDAELTDEYNLKCSRIQSLLNEAQVESPERFREECSRRQKLMELLEKQESRTREFSRLAGNLSLRQWQEKLQELIDTPCTEGPAAGESRQEQSLNQEPYLPYLPTIAEAEEQGRRIASTLAGAREEYARAVERVKQAFQNFRPQYEIEEDLAAAERTFGELEKNRLALEIARETLDKLSRQQQEVLAPQLNAAVEQRFVRLCAGRYEEVKIDPDFQVWVRENNTGELRLAEHLSRGTQDQLYFSMRFGIMDLVSNADEPCPGFLDEPFAAYDQARLQEAFQVLAEESQRRQILLFTCRDDILRLAEKEGVYVVRLLDEGAKTQETTGAMLAANPGIR